MAFILGSLVSAPSVTAVAGGLPEEIDAIWEIIVELQDQLNDLHVTWEKVTDKPYVVLHYEQRDLVEVPSTIQEPILIELAVWEIVKDPDPTFAHDVSIFLFETSVYGSVKKTSPGFSAAQTGWYKSRDATFSTTGMHWEEIETISARTDSFVEKKTTDPNDTLRTRYNFIAFGTTNPDWGPASSTGEVKDFSGTMTIHLSPGKSILKRFP